MRGLALDIDDRADTAVIVFKALSIEKVICLIHMTLPFRINNMSLREVGKPDSVAISTE